MKKISTGKG